jgi:5-formyltetrahydrofolate cyclo-ligase
MLEFDETELSLLRTRAKRQLRQRMRATRSSVPASALAVRSARIVEHLMASPEYEAARAVALFWPMAERKEVDLREFDTRCRRDDRELYYPAQDPDGDRIGFRKVDRLEELQERGNGFAEPNPDRPWAIPGSIDWIIVPALAVAESGHRLGYGAGFYDFVLAHFCPPARSVAVAFSFQLLAELPVEPHDRACDAIITDAGRV